MNFIKCEKLEKSMAELQFSIDAEAFKAAVADVFKKEGKKYPVQGFRKGKAPKALIETGPLTKNPVCTALALREEQVVQAGGTGYTEYYAREGMEVRKNGSVYGLSSARQEVQNVSLTEEQLEKLRSSMAKFSYAFDGSDFYDTYSFKYELEGSILQAAGVTEQTDKEAADTDEDSDSQVITGQAVGTAVSLGSQTVSLSS